MPVPTSLIHLVLVKGLGRCGIRSHRCVALECSFHWVISANSTETLGAKLALILNSVEFTRETLLGTVLNAVLKQQKRAISVAL